MATLIIFIIGVTAYIVVLVFNTKFAKVTIDYFAFFAAIFLITDALYKLFLRKDKFLPQGLLRFIRLIIGVSIFTIHVMQMVYGI